MRPGSSSGGGSKARPLPPLGEGAVTSLGRRGMGVLKATLAPGAAEAIRSSLTVAPRAGPFGPPPRPYHVYAESRSKIYIPRHLGLSTYGAPGSDNTPPGEPMRCSFSGELRPGQVEPVAAFLRAAEDPLSRGGIINMSCAAGKTVMGINAACRLGLRTLVVVHKEFLASQWEERISQFAPSASVGRIQGRTFDVEGRDFVVAMVQTLSSRDFDDDAFDSFGTLIVDECHHMSAEVFSKALLRTNFRHSLGLSATLRRSDGLSHVFQWFIGDVVFRSAPSGSSSGAVDVVIHRVRPSLPVKEVYTRGSVVNVPRLITSLCEDGSRTESVARVVSDAARHRSGSKVLVLSDRRAHLDRIRSSLHPDVSSAFYVGGMKPESLKQSELAQVVLGTYSMAAEGMDIPSLDTLVLATPKSSVEQPVGRILRIRPEDRKRAPLVIDIVDDSPFLASLASRRASFYSRSMFSIMNG